MAERLAHPTGDLEFGQEVQVTRAATIPIRKAGANYVDFGTLTVSTTAVPLPSVDTIGRDCAIITVETDKVRFRFNSNPTSSAGHELEAGDSLELDSAEELSSIRFIRSGVVDATLQISYGVREIE